MPRTQSTAAQRRQQQRAGEGRSPKPSTAAAVAADATETDADVDNVTAVARRPSPPTAPPQTTKPTTTPPPGSRTYSEATAVPKYHVLPPRSFLDTFAVLTILLVAPWWVAGVIQLLYVSVASPSFRWQPLPLVPAWLAAGAAPEPPGARNKAASVVKVLALSLLAAVAVRYLTPAMRSVTAVLAKATVAAALGGTFRSPFINAVYTTTIVEVARFVWDLFCHYWQLETAPTTGLFALSMRTKKITATYDGPLPPTPVPTLLDVTNTSSADLLAEDGCSILGSLRQVDWRYELPSVVWQMVIMYVIWLGLSAFLRNDLWQSPDSTESTATGTTTSTSGPAGNSTGNASKSLTKLQPASQSGSSIETKEEFSTAYSEEDVVIIAVSPDVANPSHRHEDLAPIGDANLFPSRKSKRAVIMRTTQPIWYTLARSVVMAARYEHMPNAPPQPDQQIDDMIRKRHQTSFVRHNFSGCFVSHVFENSICFFAAGAFANSPKMYTVKVNKVQWKQVIISPVNVTTDEVLAITSQEQVDEEKGQQSESPELPPGNDMLLITVHGLTDGTVYDLEILENQPANGAPTGVLICKAKVSTAQSKSNNGMLSSRPLSPITTLLNTLQQLEVTLNEAHNNIKKARKDHSKKVSNLRAEIDQIRTKAETNSKADERTQRKVLALRSTVKQLEQEIAIFKGENLVLTQQVEDELQDYHKQKTEWKQKMNVLKECKNKSDKIKEANTKTLAQIELEKSALLDKQAKLNSKRTKYTTEITQMEAKIDAAILQDLESRKQAREDRMKRRVQMEAEFTGAIDKMESGARELESRRNQILSSLSTRGYFEPGSAGVGIGVGAVADHPSPIPSPGPFSGVPHSPPAMNYSPSAGTPGLYSPASSQQGLYTPSRVPSQVAMVPDKQPPPVPPQQQPQQPQQQPRQPPYPYV